MKTPMSFYAHLAAALLLALLSNEGIASAQTDTCFGAEALASVSEGCLSLTSSGGDNYNSAFGYLALSANHAGQYNTAIGANTLQANTQGGENTAIGSEVLQANTSGGGNTATGSNTLELNTTGSGNTATGAEALGNNTSGLYNTAVGLDALNANASGNSNTAVGYLALQENTAGRANTAVGQSALQDNTGDNNIGIGVTPSGAGGGSGLTTGNNNIDIGNTGVPSDDSTVRIGTQGLQTATYIAGIFGTAKIKKGCDVVVENTGLLGCVKSSARYKSDIRDMGRSSEGLMKLRPVTFRYKDDQEGTKQYGLLAEEVEQVYPELVVYGTDGKVESVRYSMLNSMLLNELQKQERDSERKAAQLNRLAAQVAADKALMQKQIDELNASHERQLGAMRAAFEERLSQIEQVMASKDGKRALATAFNP